MSFAKNKTLEFFNFLHDFGYDFTDSHIGEDGSIELSFNNLSQGKKVDISINNTKELKHFFIFISVVSVPYKSVDDYVSLNEYLTKNKIEHPELLEGEGRTEENIEQYIKKYAELFKAYGIKLISTKEQFPGYYPEWT